MAAKKPEEKQISVDEHNAEVAKQIAALQSQIDELKKTYKSESDKKQASLHECLTKFPK